MSWNLHKKIYSQYVFISKPIKIMWKEILETQSKQSKNNQKPSFDKEIHNTLNSSKEDCLRLNDVESDTKKEIMERLLNEGITCQEIKQNRNVLVWAGTKLWEYVDMLCYFQEAIWVKNQKNERILIHTSATNQEHINKEEGLYMLLW